jgi:uncharacterized membrane protein YdjX (TVP38/TMEM64 family)
LIESLPLMWLAALFFVIYSLACALPVPGTRLLAIGAGTFFPKTWAFALVLLGSTAGAYCGFVIVRRFFRIRSSVYLSLKFPKLMPMLNSHNKTLLLSLRLSPVVPFSAVHAMMAVSEIKLLDFMAITFLGSVIYSSVWVFSGWMLSEWFHKDGNSLLDKWEIVLALIVVSLVPILLKWLIGSKRSSFYLGS